MRKLAFLILCCGFLASCSKSEENETSNLPAECQETFKLWEVVLDKEKKSGIYSPQTIAASLDNKNFFEKRLHAEASNPEKQKRACSDMNTELQRHSKALEDIANMSPEERERKFGAQVNAD